jgi:HK97 family phage portal protein
MAIVESNGALVGIHRETLSPSISRSIELWPGNVQTYAELYKRQPNLRTVVRFLGRNIAQLGLKPYRRVSATERIELDRRHPLQVFLRNPTPALPVPTSRHAWIRGLVEDLALYDLLYALKMRNSASDDLNAIRLPPPIVDPAGDSFFYPERFVVKGNAGERSFDARAVIYLHGHNPADPRTGLSPVEALRQILAEEAEAERYRQQFWRNGARMTGIIERPKDAPRWKDSGRERFLTDWRSMYSGDGPGAAGTPVLEDGMTWKEASFSAKDSEYLGARRLTREECASAYFIPPVFVGILENANFSNVKEQHVSLYADTLGPWCDWLTDELELQLVPEFPDVEDVYL